MNIIVVDPPTPYDDQINLGPVYLASYLESIGHTARVVDMNFRQQDNYPRLLDAIQQLKPDIIGISIMTYFAFGQVKRLLRFIEEWTPGTIIVVGGASPTVFAGKMLEENPEIDFAVVGEGEATFGELCEVIQKSHDSSNIKGLAYRDIENVYVNERREPIKELDSLPLLNFDLIDLVKQYGFVYYRNTFVMATSRGCPFACSMCLSSILCQRRWRAFSAKRVADEIQSAYWRYGLTRVSFEDDNFVMLPDRVIEICRMIRERNLPVKLCLEGGIRADRLTQESLAALLSVGVEDGFLAVESGSPKVFEQIGKGETLTEIETTLKMLQKAHIDLQCYMILGLPTDTHKTFLESMAFLKKYKVKGRWHFAYPFEKTKMYDYVKEHGTFLRKCEGYDLDIVTYNDITTPGTVPMAFDTPEYREDQRRDDYYRAVIDSEAFFYILGKYKNRLLVVLRTGFLVAKYRPAKLPAYMGYVARLSINYLKLKGAV